MFSPASSVQQLVLNCLVLGDQRSHIFPVEISATKSVGMLKDLIKEKKHPHFQYFSADNLVLWKISEAVDENLENKLEEANFPEKEPLSPVDKLSNVFSVLPVEGHLHIVVGRPDAGKSLLSLCSTPV